MSDQPWLHRITTTDSDLSDWAFRLALHSESRVVCRVIRGRQSRSTQRFFDEISAAFQFPYYFGENWNAFDECLCDLEWLPARAYLVLVSNAVHLLEAEPPADFRALIETFERIAKEWRRGRPEGLLAEVVPRPFHVVLHSVKEDEHTLDRRLIGVDFNTLAEGFIDEVDLPSEV
jgi:RNAse (barnase) inhibitor barstar